MKRVIFAGLLLGAFFAQAQERDLTGKVAFVRLTTTKESTPYSGPEQLVRNVLLRLTQAGTANAFLAMSDQTGSVVVPLEAGTWCVQPYTIDGQPVKLSQHTMLSSHRCFTAVPGLITEFGVTLAFDVKLNGSVPGLRSY